jgi:hypothetical protein
MNVQRTMTRTPNVLPGFGLFQIYESEYTCYTKVESFHLRNLLSSSPNGPDDLDSVPLFPKKRAESCHTRH